MKYMQYLRQFKGDAKKRIRYARVVLKMRDRKAVSINYIDYGYPVFDPEIGIETDCQEQRVI